MDHLTIGLPNSLPNSLPGLALGLAAFLALGVLGLVLQRAPARRHAWAESVLVASLVCAALLLAPLRRPLQPDALVALAEAAPELAGAPVAELATALPDTAPASAERTRLLPARSILTVGLAIGAGAICLRLLVGGVLLVRLVRRSTSLPPRDDAPGLRLVASERTRRPFCAGTKRFGVIVVPLDLTSEDSVHELDAVVAHERAHLEAGHGRARLTAALAAPLLFWNPLYWLLVARMRADAELCADDAAARVVGRRRYARALLSLVERAPRTRIQPLLPVLGVLAPTPSLIDRLESLMSRSQPLDLSPSRRSRAASVVVALAALSLVNAACGTTGAPRPEVRDGRTVLTFQTLDLEGTAIERALETRTRTSAVFPTRVQALNGRTVTMEGYFIPLLFEDDRVSEFLLLRDNLACCMGGAPKWGHWVHARADGVSSAEFLGGGRVRVDGEFSLVHPNEWVSEEYTEGVYQLRRWTVHPVDL